jgi:hypothetical protein
VTLALFNWMPPSVSEFVVAWLRPLGDPNGVGLERPSGAVLPYRMVTRVAGSDDKITESSVVSVHTFADNMDDAETAAQLTHRRMLALGPPLASQQPVTMSDSSVVVADCVTTKQSPIWVDYDDNTIRRFVARYEIDLRFRSV